MWDAGLLEEVARLDAAGLREGRTAAKALGYSQALAHLDGRLSAAEAIDDTITATRRFARRQEKWFRADPRTHWLAYDDPRLCEAALTVLAAPSGLPSPGGPTRDRPTRAARARLPVVHNDGDD